MSYGQLISKEDAAQITGNYNSIRSDAKAPILSALQSQPIEREYYEKAPGFFVFDLALVKDFIFQVEEKGANLFVVLNASNNDQLTSDPTVVLAGATEDKDTDVITIVGDENGKVPQHPKKTGTLAF